MSYIVILKIVYYLPKLSNKYQYYEFYKIQHVVPLFTITYYFSSAADTLVLSSVICYAISVDETSSLGIVFPRKISRENVDIRLF